MATVQRMSWCRTCDRKTLHIQQKESNLFHLILTLVTGGLWLVVWIFAPMRSGSAQCTSCGETVWSGLWKSFKRRDMAPLQMAGAASGHSSLSAIERAMGISEGNAWKIKAVAASLVLFALAWGLNALNATSAPPQKEAHQSAALSEHRDTPRPSDDASAAPSVSGGRSEAAVSDASSKFTRDGIACYDRQSAKDAAQAILNQDWRALGFLTVSGRPCFVVAPGTPIMQIESGGAFSGIAEIRLKGYPRVVYTLSIFIQ
jgi:hypothetical protein